MSKEHYRYVFSSAWSKGGNIGTQEVAFIEFDAPKIPRIKESEFFSCIFMQGEDREPEKILDEIGIIYENLSSGRMEGFGNGSGMPSSLRRAIADTVNHAKGVDENENVRYIVVNSVERNEREGEKNFVSARRDANSTILQIYGYRDGSYGKEDSIDRVVEVRYSEGMDLADDNFPKANKVIDKLERMTFDPENSAGSRFDEVYGAASAVQMQMPYRGCAGSMPDELIKRRNARAAAAGN